MNKTLTHFLALWILAAASPAFAQLQDVQITATKKRLDEQKQRADGNKTITTKDVTYTVSVQNKRFNVQPEIIVKYRIFLENEAAGSTADGVIKTHKGSETLTNLAANATATFETKPFQLTTEDLDGGWYYATGATNRAKDKVKGIWIRAYADGKIIGEYANPSTISKKNDWKD